MPNYILTKSSVILCPHGGMVTHSPMSYSGETINGEVPMLLTDMYFVAGCPFSTPTGVNPCSRVNWANGSPTRLIRGVPVLTSASIGLVASVNGAGQGTARVVSFQTVETD